MSNTLKMVVAFWRSVTPNYVIQHGMPVKVSRAIGGRMASHPETCPVCAGPSRAIWKPRGSVARFVVPTTLAKRSPEETARGCSDCLCLWTPDPVEAFEPCDVSYPANLDLQDRLKVLLDTADFLLDDE
jgi:hypothetical protein